MISKAIAVVGAGIAGRLTALFLHRAGFSVQLFEKGPPENGLATAFAAGGMLAPIAERESATEEILSLGRAALKLWPAIAKSLRSKLSISNGGSLIVAHPEDHALIVDYRHKLEQRGLSDALSPLSQSSAGLKQWQPGLSAHLRHGFVIQEEAHMDPQQCLKALELELRDLNVPIHWHTQVTGTGPGWIQFGEERQHYSLVVDTRGLGLRDSHPELRGVRGEAVLVRAEEVTITQTIRLLHRKHPLYVIPRADHHYYLGASSIESEQTAPITVRSIVELLSAAVSIHPGFMEASVMESYVGLRPALPDHKPRIRVDPRGLIAVVGLYRHGILLAPLVADRILQLVLNTLCPPPQLMGADLVEHWYDRNHH